MLKEKFVTHSIHNENLLTIFVKETYKLFAASLLAGGVGAYIGMSIVQTVVSHMWLFIIAEFSVLFATIFLKNKPGLNLIALFGFTFLTGITSAPLLSYALAMPDGGSIIGNAFAMTALIMGVMSYIGVKSKVDMSMYSKALFISLIVIVVFSLLNILLFHNSILSIVISGATAILFSILTIYDTQNIVKGAYETPIEGAIALYLDFLNIFLSLINLLLESKE